MDVVVVMSGCMLLSLLFLSISFFPPSLPPYLESLSQIPRHIGHLSTTHLNALVTIHPPLPPSLPTSLPPYLERLP